MTVTVTKFFLKIGMSFSEGFDNFKSKKDIPIFKKKIVTVTVIVTRYSILSL